MTDRTTPPTLTIDVAEFEHYLDDSGLSAEEKTEYLETVWAFVRELILLGWGIHPLQEMGAEPCGKDAQSLAESSILDRDMLDYVHRTQKALKKENATQHTVSQGEGVEA